MKTSFYDFVSAPFGEILLVTDEDGALTHLYTRGGSEWVAKHPEVVRGVEANGVAANQVREYLEGDRKEFDLVLAPSGTPFQLSVWNALLTIPFGEARNYGQQAALIGNPNASRAVGAANGQNPISIAIPCHRVIGANGSLVGYGGGLATKEWLLRHEGLAVQSALEI
ncbi:methylated-DNA--[protein]-cysteine S-methyltransferase [soil metagenome]